IARLMNQWFVCIKVDREERPDIDNIYMTALNVGFRQRGGWPLSMFLTADAKPIIGGTYWPPEDKGEGREKVTGFRTVLTSMHDLGPDSTGPLYALLPLPKADHWKRLFSADKREEMHEQASRVAELTAEALARAGRGIALVELNRELVASVIE